MSVSRPQNSGTGNAIMNPMRSRPGGQKALTTTRPPAATMMVPSKCAPMKFAMCRNENVTGGEFNVAQPSTIWMMPMMTRNIPRRVIRICSP